MIFGFAGSVGRHSPARCPLMITHPSVPSIATFAAFVQLKDYRQPTKKEYVRYVRRLGDRYQCDPATLTEDQVRAYYLELRQVRKFGGSAMKVARCALRCFFREHLKLGLAWTVFEELRIAPPQTLPLVLAREQVATLLKAVQLPRYRALLGLIYHTGLRVGKRCGLSGAISGTRPRSFRGCTCAAARAARIGSCPCPRRW